MDPKPQYSVLGRRLDFALFGQNSLKLDLEIDGRKWHEDTDGNRKIDDHGVIDDAMRCPEDVEESPPRTRDDAFARCKCRIPARDDCWAATLHEEKIPKGIANDDVIGHSPPFTSDTKVSRLDAAIASPVYQARLRTARKEARRRGGISWAPVFFF